MFEFLGASEIVHLVESFMHKWHQIDDHEEVRHKRLRIEYEGKWKKYQEGLEEAIEARREQLRKNYEEQIESAGQKADTVEMRAKTSPTLSDISETTGVSPKELVQAMKAAEDKFVHWPEPGQPDMTRIGLREHAEQLGLQNWQPGAGF